MSSPGTSTAQLYVVCSCGAGKDKQVVSHFVDVFPGDTIRTFRARYRQWLRDELLQGNLDYKVQANPKCGDLSQWRCTIKPSIF